MEKDSIAKWQRRIEQTFKGPNDIVGERVLNINAIENDLQTYMINKFTGYVTLMDSFFDFYSETLNNLTARKGVMEWPKDKLFITAILVPNFLRFRASYLLFWRGYFTEGLSLLRGIFENVLEVAAIGLGVISTDEIFGQPKDGFKEGLSDEENQKLIRSSTIKGDQKVRLFMIGEKSGLSQAAVKDFKVMFTNLHNTVHKTKFNTLWQLEKLIKEKKAFYVYPTYDEGLAASYLNISYFMGWMVLHLLPLLQLYKEEFSDEWLKKYRVLDESFQFVVKDFKRPLGRSVEELIEKKLNSFSPHPPPDKQADGT
ncbi:MAG: hypothetical protein JRF53_02035 [Deltaproteobacteria bacterium]|nr:hypothetical protein [Deltaproteobacteria bacterium]